MFYFPGRLLGKDFYLKYKRTITVIVDTSAQVGQGETQMACATPRIGTRRTRRRLEESDSRSHAALSMYRLGWGALSLVPPVARTTPNPPFTGVVTSASRARTAPVRAPIPFPRGSRQPHRRDRRALSRNTDVSGILRKIDLFWSSDQPI